PQSRERENMIFVLWLPVKRLQTRYTLPAGTTCGVPKGLNVHVPPPARGMSTAIQGLSMNWPDVPVSTIFVDTYLIVSLPCVASPFSFWFASRYRATKTAPLLVPRLKAMPL